MKYADYKIEDMYFSNGAYTDEDITEILETFPETKDSQEVIKICEQMQVDIDNGVLKTNSYGEINRISAKAYARKHDGVY